MSVWTVLEMADKHATLAINNFSGGFTDALMPVLSNRLVWIPAYLLLLWYLWKQLGWKKTLLVLLAAVVAVAACDQFANLIKHLAHRYRPCWDQWMVDNGLRILEKKGGRYGFFSAHAATTAAIATVILAFVRRLPVAAGNDENKAGNDENMTRYKGLGWCFGIWVFLVSISRIYVGKHFLGDIMVGAAVGILLGWTVFKLTDYLVTLRKWEKS